jgi:FkbM family methyltransferase
MKTLSEPRDVVLMRFVLNHWPLSRGKGILLRSFWPWIKHREFLLRVELDVYVPADLTDYILMHVFVHGYGNQPTVWFSRRLLRPGDTVIDIGANTGLFAMGAARVVGNNGWVHAFEPVPRNADLLDANLELNGIENVIVNRLALSQSEGVATFYSVMSREESRCLSEPTALINSGLGSLAPRPGADTEIKVPVQRLDEYIRKSRVDRVDFIKIDVEGAEKLVLEGAEELLSRVDAPIIMFEADDRLPVRFGSTCRDVKQLLADHGYEIWNFGKNRLTPVSLESAHDSDDLFALKPHHLQRARAILKI